VAGTTLEEFCCANIWFKLGMNHTTFHPDRHRDILPQQMEIALRDTGRGSKSVKPGTITLKYPLQNDLGGIGLFSTAADYAKLLAALVSGGHPLLHSSSVDVLLSSQLNEDSREAMPKLLGFQMKRVLGLDGTMQADHSLAGTMTLRDNPHRRRKGTVSWAGLPNLHWVC